MNLIFAKWIISAAIALSPGNDLPWPAMQLVAGNGIEEMTVVEDVWTPPRECQAGDTACVPFPGGFTAGSSRRYLCAAEAGVYQVTAQVGLKPLPAGAADVNGQIWMVGPDGVMLLRLFAAAGHWSAQGATHILVTTGRACWTLRYDLTGPATVNEWPGVTYLAIHRL